MSKITSTVAKTEEGTVQVTFTIPFDIVKQEKEHTLKEFAEKVEVAGFRKGKAPLDKVEEKIPKAELIEHALGHILPRAFADAVTEHKIAPAMYPKFQIVKSEEGSDWEVKAETCELPQIDLGDYRNTLKGALSAGSIWTPDKGNPKEKAEPSKQEKEQAAVKAILETVKIKIPKILITEEVNARLSSLLERLDKLGLNIDGYLSSIGKTPESLRAEYEQQAENTIKIELALNEIARKEEIKVTEGDVDEAIKAASADPKVAERLKTPEQRRMIQSVLKRRSALDSVISLM